MAESAAKPMRRLPPEVILQIVNHIDAPTKELRDLSLISSVFRTACQSRLFRGVKTRPTAEKFAEQCKILSLPHIVCHIREVRVCVNSILPTGKYEYGQESSEDTDQALQRSWENKFVVELTRLLQLNAHMIEEISIHSDLRNCGTAGSRDSRNRYNRSLWLWYHDDIPTMLGRAVSRVLGRLNFPRLKSLEFEQTKDSTFSKVMDLDSLWDDKVNLEEYSACYGADFAYDIMEPYRKRPFWDQKEDKEALQKRTSLVETLPPFSRDQLLQNTGRIVNFHCDLRSDDSGKIIKLFSDLSPPPPPEGTFITGLPWWSTPKVKEQPKQYQFNNRLVELRLHLSFNWNWQAIYISLYRLGNLTNLRALDIWNFTIGDGSLSSVIKSAPNLEELSFFACKLRHVIDTSLSAPDSWGGVFDAAKTCKKLVKFRLNRLKYLNTNKYCDRTKTLCPMFKRDVESLGELVAQIDKQRVTFGEPLTLEELRISKNEWKDWGGLDTSDAEIYCSDHIGQESVS